MRTEIKPSAHVISQPKANFRWNAIFILILWRYSHSGYKLPSMQIILLTMAIFLRSFVHSCSSVSLLNHFNHAYSIFGCVLNSHQIHCHKLCTVCILIDNKLYNDTWKLLQQSSALFTSCLNASVRFNIDEWICDLLHKNHPHHTEKCAASYRCVHWFVTSLLSGGERMNKRIKYRIPKVYKCSTIHPWQYEHHTIVWQRKKTEPKWKML